MNVILEFPKILSKLFFMSTINFGNNLKFLRKKKGITQTELGVQLERKHTSIGNWESGFNQPSLTDLVKIAIIFGISIDDLLNSDLSDVNLNSKKQTPKNRQNVNLNVNPSVNLNAQNDHKKLYDQAIELAKNELHEPDLEYVRQQNLLETLSTAVRALERANAQQERIIAKLEEENSRLKSEIPEIGKPVTASKARAS